MVRFFRKYVPAVLLSAVLGTAACSDADPAGVTAPSPAAATSLTAEPKTIRPEFLPNPTCSHRPAFRGGFSVIVGSTDDVVLRGMHFSFIDVLGGRTSPLVTPTGFFAGAATSIPTSGPIPIPAPGFVTIPGSSAVTLPGAAAVHGVLLPANTFRTLPFAFEFGCGVLAEGTLVVTVETSDRKGRRGATDLRVTVTPAAS